MVIMAFSGVGKTYLAAKYPQVCDLESSFYEWIYEDTNVDIESQKGLSNRTKNKTWPHNYIVKIKESLPKYDIILVGMNKKVRELLEKEKVPFILAFPSLECKKEYLHKYKLRNNTEEFIARREEMFDTWIKDFMSLSYEKWVLNKNEHLEDALKKRGLL